MIKKSYSKKLAILYTAFYILETINIKLILTNIILQKRLKSINTFK